MFPGSHPSRPKPPQQPPQPTYVHQQQRTTSSIQHTSATSQPNSPREQARPNSQIEAMPPNRPPPNNMAPLFDSAVRHPVFFTQNLKKPPFSIPQIASQGWSPVANGYIMEQQRALNGPPRNKL